jgi:hypothetical protein
MISFLNHQGGLGNMGMLFTTVGTKRIVETLNTAFQDLSVIRGLPQYATVLPLLQSTTTNNLSSVTYYLRIYPYRQKNPNQPGDKNGVYDVKDARRWKYFLDNLDLTSAVNIQGALATALQNTNMNRVVFDHVAIPGTSAPASVVVFDAPNPVGSGRLMSITLMTVEIDPSIQGPQLPAPSNAQVSSAPWASIPPD